MNPPITKDEQELLEWLLREIRHSMATKEQLTICVDPFAHVSGYHVHVSFNPTCQSVEFTGKFPARKIRGRPER